MFCARFCCKALSRRGKGCALMICRGQIIGALSFAIPAQAEAGSPGLFRHPRAGGDPVPLTLSFVIPAQAGIQCC